MEDMGYKGTYNPMHVVIYLHCPWKLNWWKVITHDKDVNIEVDNNKKNSNKTSALKIN